MSNKGKQQLWAPNGNGASVKGKKKKERKKKINLQLLKIFVKKPNPTPSPEFIQLLETKHKIVIWNSDAAHQMQNI